MSPATSQAASGAMSYEKIAVHPITTALGAEIEGVDLGRPLDNQTADEVHRALLENLVIFFRGQDMSTEAHKAFARSFGPLNIHPYVEAIPGDPEILEVLKDVDDTRNFGGLWHIDLTFLEKPPLGSVIYAKEVPESGGDTLWSNMTMAYEALSDGMKALLDGLIGVHAALNVYGPKAITGQERRAAMSMQLDQTEKAVDSADHPIVRTHPETGRKCLFLSGRRLFAPLQGHDRGGKRAAFGLPQRPRGPAGIHLPLPLGE